MTPVSSFLYTIHLAWGIWSTVANPELRPNIQFDEVRDSLDTAILSNPASLPNLDLHQSTRFKATSYEKTPVAWQTDTYLSPLGQIASGEWSDVDRHFSQVLGAGSGAGTYQHQGQISSGGSCALAPASHWPQAGMDEHMKHPLPSWPLDPNNEPWITLQREHDYGLPLDELQVLDPFFAFSHQDIDWPGSEMREAPALTRIETHELLEEPQSPSVQLPDDVQPNAPFTRLEQITDVTGKSFTLKVQLEKIRLTNRRSPPHAKLDLDFLKKQKSMYDKKLAVIFRFFAVFRNGVGAAAMKGEGLPVRFWKHETSWCVRVMTRGGECSPKEHLGLALVLLIKWMSVNNKAFYEALEEPKETIEVLEDELFRWLFQEVFAPDYGAPVIGTFECDVQSRQNRKHGPVQRWIINCLTTRQHTFITSLAILGIWYKTYKAELWKFEEHKDVDYWRFMDGVMNSALNFKIQTASALDKPKMNEITIRERLIEDCPLCNPALLLALSAPVFGSPRVRGGTKFYRPSESFLETNEPLEQQKEKFMGRIKWLHQNMQGLKVNNGFEFEDILVAILKLPQSADMEDERFCSLRLMQKNFMGNKELIKFNLAELRIKTTVDILHSWHNKIQNYQPISTQDGQLNTHYLFNWIFGEILAPHGSLPLLSHRFPQEEIQHRNSKAFGKVQAILLEILTKPYQSQVNWNYTILSILGYWYKTKFGTYWTRSFGDDKGFWSFIIVNSGALNAPRRKRKATLKPLKPLSVP